ncbi:pyrroloquinoline quinone precursor peptide PqqA [Candidatus Methylacidiphilum infernorum]|nr:pyrroloquinoline quinone precursor peptide PqqA [Candidatus Methylacidiphilum infernorum]QSR86901.1 pyrroloquinoline quinone precursor peptide PqqA [Candidatus Methylacidiphilum infernorum]
MKVFNQKKIKNWNCNLKKIGFELHQKKSYVFKQIGGYMNWEKPVFEELNLCMEVTAYAFIAEN